MPREIAPLWQQRLAAVVIGLPVVIWAFFATLARETAGAVRFAWLDARGCAEQAAELWRGEYVEPCDRKDRCG